MSGERVGKLLERVARELASGTYRELLGHNANSELGVQLETREEAFQRVLEERLGPLLRAADAMQQKIQGTFCGCHDSNDEGWHGKRCVVPEADKFRAALAALEREQC